MRLSSVFMSLLALVIAVLAGVLSKNWLESQRRMGAPVVVAEKPAATTRIVVATQQLRFGQELGAPHLKEIDWPVGAIPTGAFASLAELIKSGERRVVLSAIEVNEPILKFKITGPGQRASLSSLIGPGMKAVTIRVNDVFGVAGFVLPGDRVDILLTRNERPGGQGESSNKAATDLLLQNVRVLAIDQHADDRSEKAIVAKAVTLELGSEDAQKVTLASTLGALSLALRGAGWTDIGRTLRITSSELNAGSAEPTSPIETGSITSRPVIITREVKRSEYSVPAHKPEYSVPVHKSATR